MSYLFTPPNTHDESFDLLDEYLEYKNKPINRASKNWFWKTYTKKQQKDIINKMRQKVLKREELKYQKRIVRKQKQVQKQKTTLADTITIEETQAHAGVLRSLKITFANTPTISAEEVLQIIKPKIVDKITQISRESSNRRIQMTMNVMVKYEKNEHISHALNNVSDKIIIDKHNVVASIQTIIDQCLSKIENNNQNGSGYRYHSIEQIKIQVSKAQILRGSSYVELPKWVANKTACINIQNKDDKCFIWSVLASLHPVNRDAERVSKYRMYENELNTTGLQFPLRTKDISKFEALNPSIGINLLGIEDTHIIPLKNNQSNASNVITLLYYNNHYVLVKNINRLLNQQGRHQYHYCFNCLSSFPTREEVKHHFDNGCSQHKARLDILPNEQNANIKFNNIRASMRLPYIVYADFESLIVPINDNHCNNITQNGTEKNSQIKGTVSIHQACGYKLIVVSEDGALVKEILYRGKDSANHFVTELKNIGDWIIDQYQKNENMILTTQDKTNHYKAKACYLCNGAFTESNFKVRDHNHITGAYRGAAHKQCNLNYNNRWTKIPVVFHNGRSYDNNLFIRELVDTFDTVNIIPKSNDKYVSITADKFHFIDSACHLTNTLDGLVESLAKSGNDAFKLSKAKYGSNLSDFLRKGVYPYEYMDSFKRFEETQLPSKSAFKSSLKGDINNDDYKRAQYMFNKYCSNMGEYHDIYLESDVFLLADVFENYRDLSMEYYKLDPAWFITLPSLSWASLLKKTGQTIDLFNDQQKDMLLMTEKGIRGGVSCIIKRYSEANEDTMIRYFDANNLYGFAMYQSLPTGDYKWDSPDDYTSESIRQIADDAPRGCMLEVDLHIPADKHELLRDYPPTPEHTLITNDMLSDHTKTMKEKLEIGDDVTKKLIMSLRDKKNYVIHYRLLKHYLDLGVQITKINRVISFEQSTWMKPYIAFNSQKRAESTTAFQKDFFKLLNNSVYGKTIENVRKRSSVKIFAGKSPNLNKLNNWTGHTIYSENLSSVSFEKTKQRMDKPIIVGQAILDLSKLCMSESFYKLKDRYPNMKLLATDTDSMILELPRQFDHDLLNDEDLNDMFDLSNFPKDNQFYNPKNATIVGKFKDEMAVGNKSIDKFIGLKAKMYCCATSDAKTKHVAKGIDRTTAKSFTFDSYKKIRDDMSTTQCTFNNIRSKAHQLATIQVTKTGLSAYDNKFYQLDSINTIPYGYISHNG